MIMNNNNILAKMMYATLISVAFLHAGDDDIILVNQSGNVALVALVYTKNGKVVKDKRPLIYKLISLKEGKVEDYKSSKTGYIKLLKDDTALIKRLSFNPLYDRDVIISLGEERAFYNFLDGAITRDEAKRMGKYRFNVVNVGSTRGVKDILLKSSVVRVNGEEIE